METHASLPRHSYYPCGPFPDFAERVHEGFLLRMSFVMRNKDKTATITATKLKNVKIIINTYTRDDIHVKSGDYHNPI